MSVPGQRSAQQGHRAAVAVQRVLGRAAQAAGMGCEEIGLTTEDGRRVALSVDAAGREVWTDEAGAVAYPLPVIEDDDED